MRIFLVYFLFCQLVIGQKEELAINFIDNDLNAALDQAKKDQILIFIDAYTTWCGPCKMMDRDVFTDSAVGQFFNTNFVNLKLDMEKGSGIGVAQKYQVRGYPSFLFINAEGVLIHQGIGYQPVPAFMGMATVALDPSKQLPALEKAYRNGDKSEDLLYNYTNALIEAHDEKSKVIGKEYLASQPSWTTRKNMELVGQLVSEYDDLYYNFIVEKRHLFIKEFGEGRVDGAILRQIENHLFTNIEKVDMEKAKQIYVQTFPSSKAGVYFDNFELDYYDALGKKDIYVDKARRYVKRYPNLSSIALNGLAWNFYEKIDDKKALKWAAKWAQKSVDLEDAYFNNDTLAALYYKQNNKKKALKYALKAIELAKAEGSDFSETSALLEQIEQLP
ncbi:MAG: thioredoxin family protein [Saprospiraceae bacterium]|nr:thioredoxin family protein [Saprospiraceae bacterium]